MADPLPGSILDRLDKIEHTQKVDRFTLYDLCDRVDFLRGAHEVQKKNRATEATDHSPCLPLEKFDRCVRCEKPIVNNQPFHLQHNNCDHPPEDDPDEPWT